ncbi:ribonuclease toxin immunity protein CdiI [Neisseria sp. 23W00296]|uniref:ribonuclease toxin immunity protein CdiI n=1 Tax=unclassified Neisseria TaxID=2623750 RepID=UPI0002A2AF6C|nr:ribonuclease toxin immunity protein CdiI [Neisseria sp. oral taxon 020]EKY09305.1 hypothetical protein HMPREF9120_00467 [Neisseria sp. oral taxon 020 str. F0370]
MFIQNKLTYKKTNILNYKLIEFNEMPSFLEITIIEYLNRIYLDGYFLQAIQKLMQQYGDFSIEGCYGYYPDWESPYQEMHFHNGLVCFAVCYDDEDHRVYLTERQFFRYAKEACLRFIELHPEHRDFVMNIVDNWKPKYPDKFPD